jgi:hypothetical protein
MASRMSIRLIAAAITAALAIPAVASADDHFIEVTSAALGTDSDSSGATVSLTVIGRLAGTDAISTVRYVITHDSRDQEKRLEHCHKLGLMALNKPGKLQLDVVALSGGRLLRCGLTRLD